MTLGIDLEPIADLIEANIFGFQVWLWTMGLLWMFAVVMMILERRRRRSPVDQLLRRRFG